MKRIGLVLCGGGAKGAYQVGVFKALEELGIAEHIRVISGSSIGAINAALFLQYSADEIEQIWKSYNWPSIFGVSKENSQRLNQIIQSVNTRKMPAIFGIMNLMGVANTTGLPLKRDGFEKMMKRYLDFSKISKKNVDLLVSCGKVNTKQTRYFNLNQMPTTLRKDILLASTAVPVIFNPVYLDDGYYCDPMQIERAPLRPLLETNCDTIIIVYLSRRQRLNVNQIHDKQIIEVVPRMEIGTGIYGSLDFRLDKIESCIDLGSDDAYRILYNAIRQNPKPPRYVKLT